MMRLVLALLVAWLSWWAAPALADDNRPLNVTFELTGADDFTLTWRVPANVEARHLPEITVQGCDFAGARRHWTDNLGHWAQAHLRCPGGLADRQIEIAYPQANPNLATFARYFPGGSDAVQTVLSQPNESSFVFAPPGQETGTSVDFLVLGVEHIAIGFDHLLFVAGLVFIARTPRRVLVTVTGFTIAHSITLALSALDLIRLPIATVEAVIALSIVFLAVEILRGERDTLTWRKPVTVAGAFGLLHGFGFATVLREIGLPADGFVSALLAFNIGIEIGQVIFATILMAIIWALGRLGGGHPAALAMPRLAGYAVGTLATYWMIERLLG